MIRWAAYDARTGVPIEELPGLRVTSSISQIIGRGDQVTVSLPITDRLPDRWRIATDPGRAVIAGVIEQGDRVEDSVVIWAGWVARRQYGDGPEIQLQLQPAEEWLARNFVPTSTYSQVSETAIMRGLGLDLLAAQFHGWVEEIPSARPRDRSYTADQDKTRLSAMQDLMRVIDGPEFATEWRIDSQGLLCLVGRTASRLGRRADPDPSVLISRAAWSVTEDFSDGRGATIFTGVATREGDERVVVTRRADHLIDQGYLEVERRWQPDTGATASAVIASYVDAAYAAQQLGTTTYQIRVHLDDVLPGRDFGLGDDVAIDLANPDLPGADHSTTMRLLGWVADPDPVSGEIVQISPILHDDDM